MQSSSLSDYLRWNDQENLNDYIRRITQINDIKGYENAVIKELELVLIKNTSICLTKELAESRRIKVDKLINRIKLLEVNEAQIIMEAADALSYVHEGEIKKPAVELNMFVLNCTSDCTLENDITMYLYKLEIDKKIKEAEIMSALLQVEIVYFTGE